MSDLALMVPEALWLLVIIPLAIYAYRRARHHDAQTSVVFNHVSSLLKLARDSQARHIGVALLFVLSLTIALFAIARPSAKLLVPDDMAGIIFAIETSRSMRSPDIEPTRLEATQEAARSLLAKIPGNIKVGLTTFSGAGVMNVPLTLDRQRLLEGIDLLDTGGAYNFTTGLLTALQALPDEDPVYGHPGVIVLFSHGHDRTMNDPVVIAEAALERGIRIHTIGVGTHGNNFGDDILKVVADASEGRYYPIYSAEDLQNAHRDLGKVIHYRPKTTEVTSFPALLAAFLLAASLMISEWRRKII